MSGARGPLVAALRRRLRPLKRAIRGPAGLLLGLLLRATGRRLGVALVFHRVGDPPGDPAVELVPAQGTALVRGQLALLARHYRVVPAGELRAAAARRRRFERFPVALTFDDDWAGHVAVTLPLLREAGMHATFFLSGATLERPFDFWYERLQQAFDEGISLPPRLPSVARERIHEVAAAVERLPVIERDELVAALAQRLGPSSSEGLPALAVAALAAEGHAVGFHTRRHDTLPYLDDAQLLEALRGGREALEAVVGRPVDALAYPSGKADGRVVAAAASAGFHEAWTTMPTAVGPGSPPLWLGRVYPPQTERGRLLLVLARALLDPRGAVAAPPAQLATAA